MRASEPDPGALLSVLLAAGRGRRFERVSLSLPKPLLPVLGRPLVDWHLAALRGVGVQEAVLVVGHLQGSLREAVGDGASHGLALHFVEQESPLGIADALGRASEALTRPFLCLLGDVFFEPGDLERVAAALEGAEAVVAVRANAEPHELARNFAVSVDEAGWVRGVEEKPARSEAGWKGVGLYAFRPPFLEIARTTPPSRLRNECELTDALQRLVESGARVRAVPCAGRDFNLSEPRDLLAANLHALALSGRDRWIAQDARVDPQAAVERSIVLAGAQVAGGAHLERTLVFPGERVPSGEHRDVLFVGGEAVSAAP